MQWYREAYLLQEAFHFGIERCSSDDYFIEITAEYFHCLFAHVGLDFIVDNGHPQQQLAYFIVYPGQDVLLDNLLYDKRYTRNDPWPDFGE